MAVNIDTVYKTVLLILNKEQRGYMTPQDFNKTAIQVQLEILNEYFDDLNQQLRVPGNDSEYSDRIKNLEEKISVFQDISDCVYSSGIFTITPTSPSQFYKIGTVIYNGDKEVQYVQPNELLELNLSPITKPSLYWPVYQLKNVKLTVYPSTITSGITCTYIRKPLDPIWGFNVGTRGQYIYDPNAYVVGTPSTGSRNFELHETEQTTIILKILMYAGIIIKDPQIVQAAVQQAQSVEVNSKN
jgi:hypothetical protein